MVKKHASLSKDPGKSDEGNFLTLVGLYFAGLGWLSVVLAMAGIFYAPAIALYILAGLGTLGYVFHKKRFGFDRFFLVIAALCVLVVIFWSSSVSPTVFSGRDQGALSAAAASLSENHRLTFSFPAEKQFFDIYGPGKALNFPGFNYTSSGELVTQFPLGYISYLAAFYSLFGLSGFILANALAFLVFILSFYRLSRRFLNKNFSFWAVLFVLTSFAFSWFFKMTLSENLALALLWSGLAELLVFLDDGRRISILTSLVSFFLLLFLRIEALAFLVMVLAVLFLKYKKPGKIWNTLGKKTIAAVGVMAFLILLSLRVNAEFYVTFAKGFLNSFSASSSPSGGAGFLQPFTYVIKVFSVYALLNFLLLGVLGVLDLIRRKKYEMLVPALVILPAFFYLVHPGISADHPWMLRRFLFAVIPGCILYSVIFISHFFKKKIYAYALAAIILATNLVVSFPYLSFSQNEKLLSDTRDVASTFGENDLILVDRQASGDGWSMISGPLYFLFGKQAVYFFNPEDLKKLDLEKFSNIYFIIPDDNLQMYLDAGLLERLVTIKDYQLESDRLSGGGTGEKAEWNSSVSLPRMERNVSYGKVYLLKK